MALVLLSYIDLDIHCTAALLSSKNAQETILSNQLNNYHLTIFSEIWGEGKEEIPSIGKYAVMLSLIKKP